jgi:hypothetical protein
LDFPTHVGVNRSKALISTGAFGFPHTRGGEPRWLLLHVSTIVALLRGGVD